MHRTSLNQIKEVLNQLDKPKEAVVVVHSGLLKFGVLEGGAKGLTELLLEWLGPQATLLMPSFSFSFGRSREWHSSTTPSECGSLTEYFRKWKKTKRSLHPFHSLSILGKHSETALSKHSLSSFGEGSIWEWLVEVNAFNLSLGTEFEGGATFLHHTEEELAVPYRYYKEFPGQVYDEHEQVQTATYKMYVRAIEPEYEYTNVWDPVWDALQERRCFETHQLNTAKIYWTNIQRTHKMFREILLSDPFFPAKLTKRRE